MTSDQKIFDRGRFLSVSGFRKYTLCNKSKISIFKYIFEASQVAEPYAKANHEGFSNFDTDVLRAYIAMFDANNQYGWAMSQYLPTHGFKWLELDTRSTEYWTKFLLEQEDCQDTGYFFEVDLEYPEELHDTHDQYPLAPEHVEIKESMLSDYQKKLAKDLNMKVGGRKLCLTLQDKKTLHLPLQKFEILPGDGA